MHDIATIARQNAQAVEANIPRERAKGKFVLAQNSGLHFVGYSTHDTEADANQRRDEIAAEDPSATFNLHLPLPPATESGPLEDEHGPVAGTHDPL